MVEARADMMITTPCMRFRSISRCYLYAFQELVALFAKCWSFCLRALLCYVLLLLGLLVVAPIAYCHTTDHKTICVQNWAQQLCKKILPGTYLPWLFISQHKLIPLTDFSPHVGKTIGCVYINKQGAWLPQAGPWRSLISILLSTTKDELIRARLTFSQGGKLVVHQLIDSQQQLNAFAQIKEAAITVQERLDDPETVDVCVNTKDRLPIRFELDLGMPALVVAHNNLWGLGHILRNCLLYDQGIRYGVTYVAPNIRQSGIKATLQYANAQKKSIKRLCIGKDFDARTAYAGQVALCQTKRVQKRILEGEQLPRSTSFSLQRQCVWLGAAFNMYADTGDAHYGRFFLMTKIANQYFVQRPTVTLHTNRYFHHYVLGMVSLGVAHKQRMISQQVYDKIEADAYCGHKINLTGGYQIGEFVNRPYFRLDMARGQSIPSVGYLCGAMYTGGFWNKQTIEQGILQLKVSYRTLLLRVGKQHIRQFIKMDYLAGYHMFTGEQISTNLSEASACLQDPFVGGTKRLYMGFETVCLPPLYFGSCAVATLGFVDIVSLRDEQNKMQQRSLCKALGVGLRCKHPRFAVSTFQVKIGYAPITQSGYFTINFVADPSKELDMGEPDIMLFQAYS